jgi:hypothetical protein
MFQINCLAVVAALAASIANIASDDALILPHRANPAD